MKIKNSSKEYFWCSNCLNMSTRPRIVFDEDGKCNACAWSEKKKTLDWSERENELKDLFKKHSNKGPFDLIVPVSGGKDGGYVAYSCKHKYGLNPLCVTVNPPTRSEIGFRNLENFKKSGYPLIEINLPHKTHRLLNKRGFIDQGRPLYGWTTAIFTAVTRVAKNFGISLIMYGEDGEIEYGGSNDSINSGVFSPEFTKNVYLEKNYDETFSKLSEADKYFWEFPEDDNLNIEMAHWSYFEDWDPYRNYIVAKENCGLEEKKDQNTGTYTNFAQNDNFLYDLHTYLMYLKFGFGRATQDAGIDIRRGAMSRDQAIQLVRLYDNHLPDEYLSHYLDYYEMSEIEFKETIDKWANKDLFMFENNQWIPIFEIV